MLIDILMAGWLQIRDAALSVLFGAAAQGSMASSSLLYLLEQRLLLGNLFHNIILKKGSGIKLRMKVLRHVLIAATPFSLSRNLFELLALFFG